MINRHRKYIVVQLAVILIVVISFRSFEDKKMASVVAGATFFIGTLLVISFEIWFNKWKRSLSFYSASMFMIFFVLPTLYLRFISWDSSFELAKVFGFSGGQIHKMSSTAFMVMVFTFFIQALLDKKKPSV